MWHDMGLYWAWRGAGAPPGNPPTAKRLEYATIRYPHWWPEPMTMRICCGVFDDDERYRELGREEIDWHIAHGAEVTRHGKTPQ